MLIMKNHGFKRRYAYGGSGIFDSLTKFISNLISSNASKQLAATTLDVGRKTAVEVGKAAAIDVGKKIGGKGNQEGSNTQISADSIKIYQTIYGTE